MVKSSAYFRGLETVLKLKQLCHLQQSNDHVSLSLSKTRLLEEMRSSPLLIGLYVFIKTFLTILHT